MTWPSDLSWGRGAAARPVALWSGSVGGMGTSLFTGLSEKDLSGEFVTLHCHVNLHQHQTEVWDVNQESPSPADSGDVAVAV